MADFLLIDSCHPLPGVFNPIDGMWPSQRNPLMWLQQDIVYRRANRATCRVSRAQIHHERSWQFETDFDESGHDQSVASCEAEGDLLILAHLDFKASCSGHSPIPPLTERGTHGSPQSEAVKTAFSTCAARYFVKV